MKASATINLSVHNSTNVKIWFSQLKAIFNAKQFTFQSSRYAYLVEKLPADVVREVVDLFAGMPEERSYDTLKNAIIWPFERRLRDLFNNVDL